jgi:FRG domain
MAKKSTTKSVPPRTLTDFIEAFAEYLSGSSYLKCFRGQRDATWPTVAGIFRPEFKELLENEKRAVRDLISVHPSEFAADETMFDKLVRMQHFGLPTRLLDVSRNALVALYFATEPSPHDSDPSDGMVTAFAIPPEREKYFDSDSVSCIANLANMTSEEKGEIYQLKELLIELPEDEQITKFNDDGVIKRLHQFIRSEKSYFQPIIKPIDLLQPYYVHPKMSNRRILAQAGAFIIYGIDPFKELFFPYEIEETPFLVPQKAKEPIRRALANLGINESTLFPEIDKAAARIKNQYKRK